MHRLGQGQTLAAHFGALMLFSENLRSDQEESLVGGISSTFGGFC